MVLLKYSLHGIGGKVAMADVRDISELAADSGVPNVSQLRSLQLVSVLLSGESLELFLGSGCVFLPGADSTLG